MSEETPTPMPEFLVSGRNRNGRRVTEIVEAHSGDEAAGLFAERGYSEIVLHTDELFATLFRPSKLLVHFTPAQMVAMRTFGPADGTLLMLKMMYRRTWWIVLLAAILAASVLFVDLLSLGLAIVAGSVVFLPALIAVYLALFGPFRHYRKLLWAIGWARWEGAMRLIPKIKLDLPAHELPVRKAQALAGLGYLSESLVELDRLTAIPDFPPGLYWGYQAMVYYSAHEYEKALNALAEAHDILPESPSVLIDYAAALIGIRNDSRRSRELLERARRHTVPDMALPFLVAGEGALALLDGRAAEAAVSLAEGLRLVHPFVRGNPSAIYYRARIEARLAIALAAVGETVQARKHFEQSRPVLDAHGAQDLLQECEQALG